MEFKPSEFIYARIKNLNTDEYYWAPAVYIRDNFDNTSVVSVSSVYLTLPNERLKKD